VSVFAHIRRFLLPLAIVVAIVAIAIPTCRMVGCDMGDMGAMAMGSHSGTGVAPMCPGQWEFSTSPSGIVPNGTDPLVLGFMAALAVAVVLIAPQRMSRPALVYMGEPPPPPDDPWGERFRV
jgi:hypothetical protein